MAHKITEPPKPKSMRGFTIVLSHPVFLCCYLPAKISRTEPQTSQLRRVFYSAIVTHFALSSFSWSSLANRSNMLAKVFFSLARCARISCAHADIRFLAAAFSGSSSTHLKGGSTHIRHLMMGRRKESKDVVNSIDLSCYRDTLYCHCTQTYFTVRTKEGHMGLPNI